MMPIKVQLELWQLLPILCAGGILSLWGGLWLLVGLKMGRNRGYRDAPEIHKAEWRKEHHERLIAEARADTAERTSKRFEVALMEAVSARQDQGLALVERRVR